MIFTNRTLTKFIFNMKKQLERELGVLFQKDDYFECLFQKEGEVFEFEVEYDYTHSLLTLYFTNEVWKEEKELVKQIFHSFIQALKTQQIDCFMYLYGPIYFDQNDWTDKQVGSVYEFDYLPIGEKAEKVITLLEKMPLFKRSHHSNIYLNHPLLDNGGIQIVPCLKETPQLLFFQRSDTSYSSSHRYDAESLLMGIDSIEAYERFISHFKQLETEMKQIKEALFLYAEEKTGIEQYRDSSRLLFSEHGYYFSLSTSEVDTFTLEINAFSLRFSYYTKEELLAQIPAIIDLIDSYERQLTLFLTTVVEEIDTCFWIKKPDAYHFYIANKSQPVAFRLTITCDTYTKEISPIYSMKVGENLRERTDYSTVEALFTTLLQSFKKEEASVRLRNLHDSKMIVHLPKLLHELSISNARLSQNITSEVDAILRTYYGNKNRSPLEPTQPEHQLGQFTFTNTKDVLIIQKTTTK